MAFSREKALAIHATLQELANRVAGERIHFRKPVRANQRFQEKIATPSYFVSDRDRVVCGLTAKAAQTHAAIGLLVNADLASDAMALARVMLENVFAISWILQDPDFRIDLFYLSSSLFRRHLAELVIQHYGHRLDLVAKAQEILAEKQVAALAERLSGSWDRWARRDADGKLVPIGAKGIFRDLGITKADGSKESFAYDVMYFSKSHAVHSTIVSLDTIFRESVCTLTPRPNVTTAMIALNSANVFLVQAFADFEQYMASACFQPELDQIWADMTEEIKRVTEADPLA